MTISQELNQRDYVITYTTGPIVGEQRELPIYNDKMNFSDGLVSAIQGNIQTEQISSNTPSSSGGLHEPENIYADVTRHQELQPADGQTQIESAPQLGFEPTDAALHNFLMQSQMFEQRKAIAGLQTQGHATHFITQDIAEGAFDREVLVGAQIEEVYDNEHNILMATEKSISNQPIDTTMESASLLPGRNNNVQLMEPNNITMMLHNTSIAPVQASPVVYAEPSNTAILSSSAVHHQIYTEDKGNNNTDDNVCVDNGNDNATQRREILREQALSHGYESGV